MKVLPLTLICLIAMGCGGGGHADSSGTTAAGTAPPDPVTPLKPHMAFPTVPLKDLDGLDTDTATLVRGRDSIVLFVSLGCESCQALTALWTRQKDDFPEGINVIGLADEEPEYAKRYLSEHPFPFPLYCDTGGVFHDSYKIRVYPSVAGVVEDTVAYLGKAVTTEFTPKKAVGLLLEARRGREGS